MTREEAVEILARRYGVRADDSVVGPGVEWIVGRIREGQSISDDDLEIALTLMEEYVTGVQRTILGAANVQVGETTGGKPRYRLGWHDVGILLGFPGSTAYMRALKLARKVGLVPASRDAT